jgi:hypothetical protein
VGSGRQARHQYGREMPPVKGGTATEANPVQERLLLLAALVAPPEAKPVLAYLERRAKLKRGSLKDCVRRRSVSKTVTRALLAAAPRLGIDGLTADWLQHDLGPGPRKSGEMPPGSPSEGTLQNGARRALPEALSPQERQMRAEVVAQHWQRVIRKHEIPWQDIVGLLWAEADWLERHHHPEAAGETRRTIAELIRRFGGADGAA